MMDVGQTEPKAKKSNLQPAIHCPHCGVETEAIQFRCNSCLRWIRSPFKQILALCLLGCGSGLLVLYLWKVVPTLAAMYVGKGMVFWLFIRISIAFMNASLEYFYLVFPISIFLYIYFGFFLKPHREWGSNAVLIASSLFTLSVSALFLITMFMLVVDLPQLLH